MKKQYEAVIEVMKENGGYSTLGHLYQKALHVEDVEWKTKTPFATIRRIVQDPRFFFKIRPGLWALKEFRNQLPPEVLQQKDDKRIDKTGLNHSYYQGLLLEIGNLKKLKTHVPSQDKNRVYLRQKLGEVASLTEILPFTYPNLVKKASTVDVVWFNERDMPHSLFEVEHSTDIHNSLLKFVELQDFDCKFFIVADNVRNKEFGAKLRLSAFRPITEKVSFMNYEKVSLWHTKTFELTIVEESLFS